MNASTILRATTQAFLTFCMMNMAISNCLCQTIKIKYDNNDYEINNIDQVKSLSRKMKVGSTFTIEITGLNTYLFNVLINYNDTLHEQKVSIPTFAEIPFGTISEIKEIIPSGSAYNLFTDIEKVFLENKEYYSGTQSQCLKYIQNEKNIYQDKYLSKYNEAINELIQLNLKIINDGDFELYKLNRIVSELQNIHQYTIIRESFLKGDKTISPDCKKKNNDFISLMNKYEELRQNIKNIIDTSGLQQIYNNATLYLIKHEINNIISTMSLLSKFGNDYNNLHSQLITEFSSASSLATNSFTLSVGSYISQIQQLQTTLNDINSLSKTNNLNFNKEFDKIKMGVLLAKLKIPQTDVIDKQYQKIDSLLIICSNLINLNNIRSNVIDLINYSNNNIRSYTSLPIQYNGKEIDITLELTPRDTIFRLQKYITKFTIPTYRNYYFASGASLYGSLLSDQAYVLINDQSTNSYYIIEETNHSKSEIGMYLHANLMYNIIDDFNIGLSIGPGVSITNKVRPRLLSGLQLAYGRRNKLVFGIGGILGEVEVLRSFFSTQTSYPEMPTNIMINKLKCSYYTSLGIIHLF